MEVSQAIRKLLFLEDFVIIPGMGGFVSEYRPAVVIKATGTFIPPVKEVVFNPGLVQNDGLLSGYLARHNQITEASARLMIEQFTEDSLFRLRHHLPVPIDGIGHFTTDAGGRIVFEQEPGLNLSLASFGLAPFHLKEIHRISGEAALHAKVPVTISAGLPHRPVRSPMNRNIRRIAIALPVLIAFSLLPNNSRIGNTYRPAPASVIPDPSLVKLNYPVNPDAGKESPAVEASKPAADVAAPAVTVAAEAAPVTEAAKPASGQFHVVAGCFRIPENAEKLHKQLVEKGYPAVVIPMRNGMQKVSIQSFATKQEAIEGLSRLRKAEPGLQLWAAI